MDISATTQPASEPVTLAQVKLHTRLDTTEIGTIEDNLLKGSLSAARQWCEQYQNRSYIWQTITGKQDVFTNTIVLPNPPLVLVDSIQYIDTTGTQQTLATSVYDVDTTSDPGEITLAYNQSWPNLRGDHHGVIITYRAGYAATCTASTGADTLTANAAVLHIDDVVRLYTTDTLPAGLALNTDYYILTVSGKAVTLATSSGGSTIDITDTGTGTHYIDSVPHQTKTAIEMLTAHFYENREYACPIQLYKVPMGVTDLLAINRVWPI